MNDLTIIIVTGLSGSGKSTALKTLEDIGFYCVDNLPVVLLSGFIELCHASSASIARIALGIDIREGVFLQNCLPEIEELRTAGHRIEVLFLECDEDVLIQRFSETRRQHPASKNGSVREGIRVERHTLSALRTSADRIVDTSQMNVHQLRTLFHGQFEDVAGPVMAVTFMSFGFKYGVPHDMDMLLDVRFLPNPYFVPELKQLTGNDRPVVDYVLSCTETREFRVRLREFLAFQIPLFEREGKSYLTVALGCTGGRHRSVTLANTFTDDFAAERERVFVFHRDIGR